jgi:hypothetical protein
MSEDISWLFIVQSYILFCEISIQIFLSFKNYSFSSEGGGGEEEGAWGEGGEIAQTMYTHMNK